MSNLTALKFGLKEVLCTYWPLPKYTLTLTQNARRQHVTQACKRIIQGKVNTHRTEVSVKQENTNYNYVFCYSEVVLSTDGSSFTCRGRRQIGPQRRNFPNQFLLLLSSYHNIWASVVHPATLLSFSLFFFFFTAYHLPLISTSF